VRNFDWLPFTPPLIAFGPSNIVIERNIFLFPTQLHTASTTALFIVPGHGSPPNTSGTTLTPQRS
jgi:hypothetical protein